MQTARRFHVDGYKVAAQIADTRSAGLKLGPINGHEFRDSVAERASGEERERGGRIEERGKRKGKKHITWKDQKECIKRNERSPWLR